jgi:hypothetical protein
MASMESVDSEPMTTAEANALLGVDNGNSQDAGETPPPISKEPTPDWLQKKNHPALANPQGAAGAKLPKPPKPTLQPSVGTATAQKFGGMQVGEAAAASKAPPAPSATAGPLQRSGISEDTIGEEDEDESDDEVLTKEEQEKADHVKKVEAVITATKAAGFTVSAKTGWLAAEAYVNNKDIFDKAGVDITECVKQGKKEINYMQFEKKLAELRAAAAQAAVGLYAGGLSQEAIGEEEEEEEEAVVYSDDDQYSCLSKQTLDAKKEQLEIDLAVAEQKLTVDPIRIAFRQFNKELITLLTLTLTQP